MAQFGYPQRQVARGFSAVPTSLTTITSTDTILFQIVLTNNTAATIQFTLQDRQGGPIKLFDGSNGFGVDPGTPFTFSVENGTAMINGMRWQASGAGLYADIIANYNG